MITGRINQIVHINSTQQCRVHGSTCGHSLCAPGNYHDGPRANVENTHFAWIIADIEYAQSSRPRWYRSTQLTGQASRLIIGKSDQEHQQANDRRPSTSQCRHSWTRKVQVTRHPGMIAARTRQPQRQVRFQTTMRDQHASYKALKLVWHKPSNLRGSPKHTSQARASWLPYASNRRNCTQIGHRHHPWPNTPSSTVYHAFCIWPQTRNFCSNNNLPLNKPERVIFKALQRASYRLKFHSKSSK